MERTSSVVLDCPVGISPVDRWRALAGVRVVNFKGEVMDRAAIKVLGCALAVVGVVGCSDNAPPGAQKAPNLKESVAAAVSGVKPPVVPNIDTSTPDFALKSWWAYLDEQQAYDARACERFVSEMSDFRKAQSLILAGDPLKSRIGLQGPCKVQQVDRQIKKVHMETETRSVIEVVMKDAIGPQPDEQVPSYAKSEVEQGFQFRYVLVKTPEGWRIEDVLRWNDSMVYLKRDPWQREYKVEPKSYFFHLPYQ